MKKETKTIQELKEAKKAEYAERIRGWEKQHGTVKVFYIEDKEGLKAVFFRQPNRFELSSAENLATDDSGKIDLYKKGERHLTDCYLDGDLTMEQILADTSVFLPIMKFTIVGLIEEKKSSWENC